VLLAQKTHQCQAGSHRQIDSQARRRANGCENADAGAQCLLRELKTCAAAQQNDVLIERQSSGKQILTDQLVEGVVTPDILRHRHESAGKIKQGGGVDPAGVAEFGLSGAHALGQTEEQRQLDCPGRGNADCRRARDRGVESGRAAHTAARTC
jgi:hypothetical protein